ncbi:MAG: hypothetical protein QOJ42_3111 [Acidobacteriaceae bacterium]|jgi:hypothetical protein|nr:hypothetical protein [Acidobacteriaceae bacterium]
MGSTPCNIKGGMEPGILFTAPQGGTRGPLQNHPMIYLTPQSRRRLNNRNRWDVLCLFVTICAVID